MKRFSWREPLLHNVSAVLLRHAKQSKKGPDLNHGLDHCLAVEALALLLNRREELKADDEVISAAALVHDVGYVFDTDREHVTASMSYAKKVLPTVGFPRKKIPAVLQVIKHHDDRKPEGTGGTPDVPEVLCVKDADTLTVLGVLGLIRLAYFSAYRDEPIVPFKALLDRKALRGWKVGTSYSSHLYSWYQELATHLHLRASKKIARQRLPFLRRFRKQFEDELRDYYGAKATKIRHI